MKKRGKREETRGKKGKTGEKRVSDFGFLVGAVGISMNLGNVPASIGSSYVGLC